MAWRPCWADCRVGRGWRRRSRRRGFPWPRCRRSARRPARPLRPSRIRTPRRPHRSRDSRSPRRRPTLSSRPDAAGRAAGDGGRRTAAAGDRSDRQQSDPAPAGLRHRGAADLVREHRRPRTAPAGGRPSRGRSLRVDRRRAAACRRPSGRAGPTCRSASSRPTTGRRPSWRSSKTCIARTSTRWRRRPRSNAIWNSYGCTQEELAGRLNLDRSTIANLIRLLELPEPVQEAIRQGKITPGSRAGDASFGG